MKKYRLEYSAEQSCFHQELKSSKYEPFGWVLLDDNITDREAYLFTTLMARKYPGLFRRDKDVKSPSAEIMNEEIGIFIKDMQEYNSWKDDI